MSIATPSEGPLSRGRAAGWVLVTSIAQGLKLAVTLMSAAILARLLLPGDFGLIAAASPVLVFAAMLQNLGLNEALVQRPNLEKAHINGLFYLMVALACVLSAALFLLAPLLAELFADPRLVRVIQAMALIAMIPAVASTPVGLMNRQLRFRELAIIDMAATVAGLTVGVGLAWATRSYWALVMSQVAIGVVQLAGALLCAGWRPGAARFDREFCSMVGLGAGFSAFNMLNFLSRNVDVLLIARSYGATALGFYDRAYKLMLFPLWQSVIPFGRVLVPVLARLHHDALAYRERYFEATAFLMAAVQPGVAAAVVFSSSFVAVFLGAGWQTSAPIFFWLGLTALHQVYTLTFGWLFVSQGRATELAGLGAISAIIAVTSFVIGLPFGALGVAMAYAIGDLCLRAPIAIWMAGRKGPVGFLALLSNLAPHAVALAASASILTTLSLVWSFTGPVALAAAAILSYAIYALVLSSFPTKKRLAQIFKRGALRRLRGLHARGS